MSSVTELEAESNFSELLDRVSRGEEVIITRHDKAVARLVPDQENVSDPVALVAEIRAFRERMLARPGFVPITDAEIREAINEGRR